MGSIARRMAGKAMQERTRMAHRLRKESQNCVRESWVVEGGGGGGGAG